MLHICVCVCTYKRPTMLAKLLGELNRQNTGQTYSFSCLVVDNDPEASGRETVSNATSLSYPIRYILEPQKGFPAVRNTAVRNAVGDYIAFIDDDEFPVVDWLSLLLKTQQQYSADGALGPVRPSFDIPPPKWLVDSRLCERRELATGTLLTSADTRTGNVLLKKKLFDNPDNLFDTFFVMGGEDVNLFKRLMAKGHRFVWCNEAIAYETVPVKRMTMPYLVRRALVQGNISWQYSKGKENIVSKCKIVAKSVAAMTLYSLVLPILAMRGKGHFARHLVKFMHHFSRTISICGIYRFQKRTF